MSHTAGSESWVRRALLQQLESLRRSGVQDVGRAAASPAETINALADDQPAAQTQHADLSTQRSDDDMPRKFREQRQAELDVIQQEVAGCTLCADLAATRTQTVFGVGNPAARLVFLGEAPGGDEDAQGEPFVGRAGKLLNDIIQKGMGLKREDVYILNILKCRPPGNRNPSPAEADNCRGFLDRQLEVLQPEFICCLGSIAVQNLLSTKQSIGKMRGRFHSYGNAKVLATYHPAYLLRNPSAKKDVWDDMKMLMHEMGIEIPASSN